MNGKKLWFTSLSTFFFRQQVYQRLYDTFWYCLYCRNGTTSICMLYFTTKLLLRYEGASWSTEQIQEQAGRAMQFESAVLLISYITL